MGDDGIFAVQMFLIQPPDAGGIIAGSAGCRKLRRAAWGHGKREPSGTARMLITIALKDPEVLQEALA